VSAFDTRLIEPTEAQLAAVLGRAMKAANRENRNGQNHMTRDAEFWGRFARDVLRSGPEGRRRSCKGGRAIPEVVAGWWTDPAGRKHVRVIGRTRNRWDRLRGEVELRGLPPWWHLYPEAILCARERSGANRYLAACRCGAVGTPESLGWMGDTCGPCSDRRADGAPPAGGFGQYSGWSASLARFAFSPDGKFLVGPSANNAMQALNRDDGTVVQAKRKSVGYVAGLACGATATTVLYQDGSAHRWDHETGETRALVAAHGTYGRGALAPDGSRAVFVSYLTSTTADLTAKRPEYVRHDPTLHTALAFSPDAKKLYATAQAGALVELHPVTLASTVLRPDPFDGGPQTYTAPGDIAVAPDGSAVLLRRDQWQPRRSLVRHVPLNGGRTVDLRVPEWHRPTAMTYSRDAAHAVTADSEGGWVGFWEVASGKSLGYVRAVLEDLAWRCGQVEFAPDGSAVAVSYNTGHREHGSTLAVWPWPDVLRAAALSVPDGDAAPEPTGPRLYQPEG
jgi:hypothetical protein